MDVFHIHFKSMQNMCSVAFHPRPSNCGFRQSWQEPVLHSGKARRASSLETDIQMASVLARKLPPYPYPPNSAVTLVTDTCPSWRSEYHQQLLSFSTKLGVTTQWLVGITLKKSLTTPADQDLPVAVCLSSIARWGEPGASSLCVGLPDSLYIHTPSEQVLEIPLPSSASSLARLSGLFPVHRALLLELSADSGTDIRRRYYGLLDPLEEPHPLPELDEKDRIIFSSQDVPLIVTRNQRYIKVWAACETAPEPKVLPRLQLKEKRRRSSLSRNAPAPPSTAALCPVQSVLQLRLVHIQTEDSHRGAGASAFLAHDMRGKLTLCLVASGTLTVLRFGILNGVVDNVSIAYRVEDVMHAVSVFGCRRGNNSLDTLVQHASGKLSLYVGAHRVCEVAVAARQAKNDSIAKAALRKKRVLKRENYDVFKVRFVNGNCARYSLKGISFKSQLVNKCIAAISFAFDETDCLAQMVNLYQKAAMRLARGRTKESKTLEMEWGIFVRILLESPESGKTANRSEVASDVKVAPEMSDWGFLTLTDEKSDEKSQYKLPNLSVSSSIMDIPQNAPVIVSGEEKLKLMRVLRALHLLYEDMKLNTLVGKDVLELASVNRHIALHICSTSYLDYYRREHGFTRCPARETEVLSRRDSHLLNVPSIFDHLVDIMKGAKKDMFSDLGFSKREKNQAKYLVGSGDADCPTSIARCVEQYFRFIFSEHKVPKSGVERAEMVLLAMVEHGFRRKDLESLPFGVALPLQNALWVCRKAPKSHWGPEAFFLIGREDLLPSSVNDPKCKTDSSLAEETRANLALLRLQAFSASESNSIHSANGESENSEKDGSNSSVTSGSSVEKDDGCAMDSSIFSLRFGDDRRLEEARRMLRATTPVVIYPTTDPEMEGDPDSKKLSLLVRKQLGSSVGRGAFTLRTYLPADPTKPLTVPEICMTGHLFGQKFAKISLPDLSAVPVAWGEFHNGVASGLRLVAPNSSCDSDNLQVLTRTWIVRHKPTEDSMSASHAGMLLALGLGGFLPALRTTDVYQYLLPRHDLTSIGLMLGLASGNRGSMQEKITKILRLHIRGFNDTAFAVTEFNVPVVVQTAAVLSLGLVYECSPKPLVLDGLFTELTRCARFGQDVDNREGLSLASGIAIGIVCLGMGEPLVSISNGNLVDRLARFANSEPDVSPDAAPVRETTGSPKSAPESGVNESDRTGLSDADACRLVELSSVNVDVVVPGALLALGLMYLKTNDNYIASRIRVPQNFYDLDRVRPDHVFLQILTRSIILWDSVQPTLAWILDCLPPFLQPPEPEEDAEDFNLLANIGRDTYGRYINPDVEGILFARAFGIAGACTSLALRFAGASNPKVISLLKRACLSFENALGQVQKDSEHTEYMYSTCLASCSLALGVASAGSGDIDIFRLLRRLRKRGGPSLKDKRYGRHMAADMAVGFLFLGGGCQTFGTSNIAIASLICSIYPKLPVDVMDNQYHLQAMRHLYVLAVEPRCVETRDVDTDTPCQVDVEVVTKSGDVLKLKAPCIVPSTDVVKHVSVVSERYWPRTVSLYSAPKGHGWYSSTKRQVLYVKRRPGHLSHRADPKGSKGILARSLCRTRPSSKPEFSMDAQDMEHLVHAFSADPETLAFVRRFCGSHTGDSEPGLEGARRLYSQVLCEYLADDRAEALRCFFDAERAVGSLRRGVAAPGVLGSMRLAIEFLGAQRNPELPLVADTDLGSILRKAHDVVSEESVLRAVAEYVQSGGSIWADGQVGVALGFAVRWYGVPQPVHLQTLSNALRKNAKGALGLNDIWILCATNLPADCSEHAIEYISKALLRLQ